MRRELRADRSPPLENLINLHLFFSEVLHMLATDLRWQSFHYPFVAKGL